MPDQVPSRGSVGRKAYERRKREALGAMRHAVEQAEKDQWFNALWALGEATREASGALQSIVNKAGWDEGA